MKSSSPPASHTSPSTSCSSSSCVIDDHPTTDRPLKLPKRPRKCANSEQCRAKGTPIGSISDTNPTKFNRRSSAYRGVTRHRWTGRFEAHLWDKSSYNSIQNKKGKQVYLGAYDSEEDAARTYDLAALKYWGLETILNFPKEKYTKELEEMETLSKQDYLASIRRRSSGFSRGVSKYRGVAKHHHNGRWEARIGRVFGNKYLYLGTFSSQEEAAKAYDLAAIQYRGRNAVTNFDISNYLPKEEPQHEENPPTCVETKPDQVQNQEQEQEHPVSAALAQTSEESEVFETFHHSPILLTEDHERKDDPWSFFADAGGQDMLLEPRVFQEEEDSNLFNLHLFHNEEDSNLFDLHIFRQEEASNVLDPRVFCNEDLFDVHVFRNKEDSNMFDPHVFRNEEDDSNLFDLLGFRDEEVEEEEDSNLFDVLNEKAFEDDVNLILDEGKWECLDGVNKGGKKIDASCFGSSSSSPSSSSTVTCDLF